LADNDSVTAPSESNEDDVRVSYHTNAFDEAPMQSQASCFKLLSIPVLRIVICSEGRKLLLQHYRAGRQVRWSGFSSASPTRQVALGFATSTGPGGVLLQLKLLHAASRSRDIRDLSAIQAEDEVVALQSSAFAVEVLLLQCRYCALSF
jgi:hypothetical protein